MNTELLIRPKTETIDRSMPSVSQDITHNNGINVGYAEQVYTGTFMMDGSGAIDPQIVALWRDSLLSREYCNLFILADIKFDGNKNCFSISNDKALTHESSENFDVNDERIKNFPSLFITTNGSRHYRKCKNPGQMFYYGIVTGINEQRKNIEICYCKLFDKPMPQQRLNEMSVNIGINANDDGVDLLNHTNWLIRRLDIRRALTEVGIEYK